MEYSGRGGWWVVVECWMGACVCRGGTCGRGVGSRRLGGRGGDEKGDVWMCEKGREVREGGMGGGEEGGCSKLNGVGKSRDV